MDPSLHLHDDQLIARLYTADTAGDAHLAMCPECSRRWEALQERRARFLEAAPRGAIHWSEQRRQILARLGAGRTPPGLVRAAWAAALLLALAAAARVWLFPPAAPPPEIATVAVTEAGLEWYEETYAVMQADEPRAALPIRVLFEPQEEGWTE